MKYVDNDGSIKELYCAVCGGDIVELETTPTATTVGCACGKTRWIYLNEGKLDLGIVKSQS